MRKYYLWLNHLRNMSIAKKYKLLNVFGKNVMSLYYELTPETVQHLVETGFISEKAGSEITESHNEKWFEAYIKDIDDKKIRWITPDDDLYPSRLRKIYDAPFTIFYKGDISLLDNDNHTIGIIGTRTPSGYGGSIAEAFAEKLSENGIVIVSGLAAGIDGRAHAATLDAGGKTIAVLGSGVNYCYPQHNYSIYERILSSGLVLSEYGPKTSPVGINFPARNRIISGLSDGLLVIEARHRSGTLITVDSALEQGKNIYAIPGRLGDPLSEGTNMLIRNGASIATSPMDILEDCFGHNIRKPSSKLKNKSELGLSSKGKVTLSPEEDRVLRQLSLSPVYIDDIIRGSGIGVTGIISILRRLEKKGYISETSPGYYVIDSRRVFQA